MGVLHQPNAVELLEDVMLIVFFLGLALGALSGMCIGALITLEWRERIVEAAQEDNREAARMWPPSFLED